MAIPDEDTRPTTGGLTDASGRGGVAAPSQAQKPPDKTKGKKKGGPSFTQPAPPPSTGGPPSAPTALKQMMAKYPNFAKYQPTISAAARLYGADPVQLYAMLVALGSHGDPKFQDPTGGTGLARIAWTVVEKAQNPSRYAEFVRKWGNQAYTRAAEPTFAINYLAWMMSGSMGNYASADAWLGGGVPVNKSSKYGRSPYQIINPEGRTPTAIIKTGAPDYQVKVPPTIPDEVAKSASKAAAKAELTDPYVAGVTGRQPGGRLVLTGDANKAMEWYGGKVTRSVFMQILANNTKYFNDYTGKNPTFLQIGNVIRNGWTEYQLINILSKGPRFTKSPIYQRDSLAYRDASKDLVPKGEKLPPEVLRRAIVNGWSIGAFQQALRDRGYYEKSTEYQNNYGVLLSSYQNIMGKPDAAGQKVIARATKLQWTQPIFESWLRRQDAYKYSPEYQAKAVGFLDSMGMFIGARAQLSELSVRQMLNVPTTVSEGGKQMQLTPPLDLMPSGPNPMLKATFPYTSTPTPPTKAGKVKEPYKAPPLVKKKTTQPTKKKTTGKAYAGHIGP